MASASRALSRSMSPRSRSTLSVGASSRSRWIVSGLRSASATEASTTSPRYTVCPPVSRRVSTRQSSQPGTPSRMGQPVAPSFAGNPSSLSTSLPDSSPNFQTHGTCSSPRRWRAKTPPSSTSSRVWCRAERPMRTRGRAGTIEAWLTNVATSPPRREPARDVTSQTAGSGCRKTAWASSTLTVDLLTSAEGVSSTAGSYRKIPRAERSAASPGGPRGFFVHSTTTRAFEKRCRLRVIEVTTRRRPSCFAFSIIRA